MKLRLPKLFGFALLTLGVVTLVNPNVSLRLLSLAPEATTGGLKLLVVKVEFLDAVHRDSDDSKVAKWLLCLNNYYQANSYGRMWWDLTVLPNWYRLLKNIDSYGPSPFVGETGFCADVLTLITHDVAVSGFTKAVFLYSGEGTHSYVGWKETVQTGGVSLSIAIVSIWLTNWPWTLEHECGHLLSLDDIYIGNKKVWWDGMGGGYTTDGNATTFSSFNKLRLGWLDGESIRTMTTTGPTSIQLSALGLSSGTRVIKISVPKPVPGDPDRYYLVEVREPIGTDQNAFPSTQGLPGVFVLSVGLDGTNSPRWVSPRTQQNAECVEDISSFQTGEGFQCPYFSMTVVSKTGSTYSLAINIFSATVTLVITTTSPSTVIITSTSLSTVVSTTVLTTTTGGHTTTLTQTATSIQTSLQILTVALSTTTGTVIISGKVVTTTATLTKTTPPLTVPSNISWILIAAGLFLLFFL